MNNDRSLFHEIVLSLFVGVLVFFSLLYTAPSIYLVPVITAICMTLTFRERFLRYPVIMLFLFCISFSVFLPHKVLELCHYHESWIVMKINMRFSFLPYRDLMPSILAAIGFFTTMVTSLVLQARPGLKRIICFLLIGFSIFNLFFSAFTFYPALFDHSGSEPVPGKYHFDGWVFLRVFYLMEKGNGYYESFAQANQEDKRRIAPFPFVQGWHMPTQYFIWKIFFSSGRQIFIAWLVLAALCLAGSFLFARRYVMEEVACVAPYLLCSYFLFAVTGNPFFTLPQYWGIFCVLGALILFAYEREDASAAAICLSCLIRAHFILAWAAFFLTSLQKASRKKILLWLGPLLVWAAAYYLHFLSVKSYLLLHGITMISFDKTDYHSAGLTLVFRTLIFGMTFFPLTHLFAIFMLILSVIGIITLRGRMRILLAALIAVPMITIFFVGNEWNDYWGALYMPCVLMTAVLAMRIFPGASASDTPPRHDTGHGS